MIPENKFSFRTTVTEQNNEEMLLSRLTVRKASTPKSPLTVKQPQGKHNRL